MESPWLIFKTLGAKQLTGRLESFQRNMLFIRQIHAALKASQTPLNSWSGGSGRFIHHIKVLSGTLKFMETLEGDELYSYVNKVFASKPELREARKSSAVTTFSSASKRIGKSTVAGK